MATAKKVPPTLEEYKAQVRETAIRVARDQNWCRDGLNAELKSLGLDPIEKGFTTELTVTFRAGGTELQAKKAILAAAYSCGARGFSIANTSDAWTPTAVWQSQQYRQKGTRGI